MIPELDYANAWHGDALDPRWLSGYQGNSTLTGRNIDLYSLGSGTKVVRAEQSVAAKAARRGHVPQPQPRVSTPRLPRPRYPSQLTYAARRQAAHDAAWAASGPHWCECGCGTDMRAGHFSRPPKLFERGHNAVVMGWKQWHKNRQADRERATEGRMALDCSVLPCCNQAAPTGREPDRSLTNTVLV